MLWRRVLLGIAYRRARAASAGLREFRERLQHSSFRLRPRFRTRRPIIRPMSWLALPLFLVSGLATPMQQVADTRFNYKRGFYSAGFTVVIQSKTEGSLIRYTTDGSLPRPDHGKGGVNPVSVDVAKTTVLRAVAYAPGKVPSNVDTQTYIFLDDVIRQPKQIAGYPNPVLNAGRDTMVELDYEMDPRIVNEPSQRAALIRGLKAIPTLSLAVNRRAMFGANGIYFASGGVGPTRKASVEFIYPDRSERSFQTNCALESHADAAVKRSLKLKFQREFGSAKLKTTFFQDYAVWNRDSATDTLDRIILRSGTIRSFAMHFMPHRTTYVRDQWARDSQIAMSGAGSHGTFVHLYINGLYWGLYNACERPDAWFTSATFGGAKDDWFAVNHRGPFQGDPSRWDYLRGTLKDKDLRNPANYQEMQGYLDLEWFADYMILAFMAGFGDWPRNNWYGGNRNHPSSPFRFFVWDAEVSWVGARRPDGARRDPGSAWNLQKPFRSSEDRHDRAMVGIWHGLRKSSEYMTLFIDRVFKHCFRDGALTEENSIVRWRALNDFIEDAVVAESARWGDARSALGATVRTRENTFYPEVEKVEKMMDGSVERFIASLRREGYYPRLDPPEFDTPRPGFLNTPSTRLRNPNPRGRIFYTVNGGDPRLPGGEVAPTAYLAKEVEEIKLRGSRTTIKARVKAGGKWSALHERAWCMNASCDEGPNR